MSTRLATGGRLIDRSAKVAFTFNGKRLSGFEGDTLASALLGAGQTLGPSNTTAPAASSPAARKSPTP